MFKTVKSKLTVAAATLIVAAMASPALAWGSISPF